MLFQSCRDAQKHTSITEATLVCYSSLHPMGCGYGCYLSFFLVFFLMDMYRKQGYDVSSFALHAMLKGWWGKVPLQWRGFCFSRQRQRPPSFQKWPLAIALFPASSKACPGHPCQSYNVPDLGWVPSFCFSLFPQPGHGQLSCPPDIPTSLYTSVPCELALCSPPSPLIGHFIGFSFSCYVIITFCCACSLVSPMLPFGGLWWVLDPEMPKTTHQNLKDCYRCHLWLILDGHIGLWLWLSDMEEEAEFCAT